MAKGEFKEIRDFDDFYEQVMDHINISEIIKISAVCLMKMISIDEWLMEQCRKTLEAFDDHRAAIIEWLESQDDPVKKAFAKELKNLLFAVEDHYVEYFDKAVTAGAQKLTQLVKNAWNRDTWQDAEDLVEIRKDLMATIQDKHEAAGIPILEDALFMDPPHPLTEKVGNQQAIVNELAKAITRQQTRVKELGTALPEGEKGTLGELLGEKSKAQTHLSKLQGARLKAKEQKDIATTTLEIFRRVVLIDPFLDGADAPLSKKAKAIARPALFFLGEGNLNESVDEIIKYLMSPALNSKLQQYVLGSGLPNVNANSLKFNLSAATYVNWSNAKAKQAAETAFETQIIPKITLLLQIIENKEQGPDGFYNAVTAGAQKGVKDAVLEIFDTNERKRLMLCAAIWAAVPAAIAGIVYLIDNWDEVTGALTSDLGKIGDAIKKRIMMFFDVERYPVMDILKEFKKAAIQIGLNLIRDIIINTVLYLIALMEDACKDDEAAGAPYTPVGQLSLSDFMIASQTENNTFPGNLDLLRTMPSFSLITSQTQLTMEEFNRILNVLSANLTMRELCGALDDTAPDAVYGKALQILENLDGLKNSVFFPSLHQCRWHKNIF